MTSKALERCARRPADRLAATRAAAALTALLIASVAAVPTAARAQNPFVDAARADAPPRGEAPDAATIVKAFVDGCIANEGDLVVATDWALGQGFEPVDPLKSDPQQLLNGQPGIVLAMPGTGGQVLMAVAADRRCMFWTERALGPGVRNALRQTLTEMGTKGAQVQTLVERAIERAGAWRQHEQLRYRRVGGSQDFLVASVTTLSPRPGAQALSFAPYAAGPARDPDGHPAR